MTSLSEHANEAYRTIREKLNNQLRTKDYTCFHVRLGDFVEMCSSEKISNIPYYRKPKDEGFACLTPLDQVKEAIISNKGPAFIMSANIEIIKSVLPDSNIFVTSEWVKESITQLYHDAFN